MRKRSSHGVTMSGFGGCTDLRLCAQPPRVYNLPSPAPSPLGSRAPARARALLAAACLVQGFELLNCDDHVGLHKKSGRNPALSRPDITHQLLLALLDSPLNKAGLLQVYIETVNNVLVEVSPHTRIPRTFKRFAGLMGTRACDPVARHCTACVATTSAHAPSLARTHTHACALQSSYCTR
ncbi:MAG: hypothetical protein EOO41_00165 [Methanobacteriota archaeon]|nr:MAG: hypothetical protein EOO41_00165 [Euryarchaeota archaeon]